MPVRASIRPLGGTRFRRLPEVLLRHECRTAERPPRRSETRERFDPVRPLCLGGHEKARRDTISRGLKHGNHRIHGSVTAHRQPPTVHRQPSTGYRLPSTASSASPRAPLRPSAPIRPHAEPRSASIRLVHAFRLRSRSERRAVAREGIDGSEILPPVLLPPQAAGEGLTAPRSPRSIPGWCEAGSPSVAPPRRCARTSGRLSNSGEWNRSAVRQRTQMDAGAILRARRAWRVSARRVRIKSYV